MDLFKNPFHILGATPRDDRYRIIELAEEKSLLSDTDKCMEARDTLTNPRRRLSAEVAWMPGVDPTLYDEILRHLDLPSQNLFNITRLTHIARANLLIFGLSRLPNLPSSNLIEWILTVARASETINSDLLRSTLNMDRRASSFPEVTDQSAIDHEIRNQKRYYSQTITSILENLPTNARARVMTSLLETTTGNGRYQCPTLIRDLIPAYERSMLEPKKKIIEAQVEQLRAMANAQQPDTTVSGIVKQLLGTLKEWATVSKSIQLSIQNTGQRHQASSEVAFTVREVALHLWNKHQKLDFAIQITNALIDVFDANSVGVEAMTRLNEDKATLGAMKIFENIDAQVEKLKEVSDAKRPDYTLSPMVSQLIQSVRSWDTKQSVDANSEVAFTVREIALHLWNKHQKLDFAIQITNALIDVFNTNNVGVQVRTRLNEDKATLGAMKIFENIDTQAKNLIEAADLKKPDYILTPMVNKFVEAVKAWDTSTQTVEENNNVASAGKNIAFYLWQKHQKRNYAIQITNALIVVFSGVYGMEEVNNQLKINLSLYQMSREGEEVIIDPPGGGGTGCLLQIVIFATIAVIIALLQGC